MMVQPNFYQSHFLCCSWEPGGRTFHLELPAALRMRILLCNRAALSPAAQHRHMSKLGHNALCCVIQQEQRKAFFHLPPGFRRLWEVHGCGDTSRLLSSCLHPSAPSLPPPSWGLQGLISNDLDPQRQSLGLPGYGGENEIAHRIIMSDPLGFLSLIRSQRASICGGFSPSKRDCHVSRDRGTQESWLMISHQQCERLFPRSISRIFV